MGKVLEYEYALVIMPNFYAYSKEIKDELENRGYTVDLFYEEPHRILFLIIRNLSNILKTSFIYRLFSNVLYHRICRKRHKYDLLIVVRGNILTGDFVDRIKNHLLTTKARDSYYTWDSFKYLMHEGKLGNHFSNCFSFDAVDVKNAPGWSLLPLFYTDTFNCDKCGTVCAYEYDICCIASFNEERYYAINKIVENNPNLHFYIRLYIDRKLFEYKRKTNPAFKQLNMAWISFELMTPTEVAKLNMSSKAVLDYTDKRQCGLSMRTIESIGLKRKLITNNLSVQDYDFYKDGNVLLLKIENEGTKIPEIWLNREYNDNKSVRSRYSLQFWTDCLLGIRG